MAPSTKQPTNVRHRSRRRPPADAAGSHGSGHAETSESTPLEADPDAYEVGYKKPPKHTRFKPGQSGNPKGRSKGHKNFATDLEEELSENIVLTEGGKRRRITKQRAVIKATYSAAVRGNQAAVGRLMAMMVAYLPTASGETLDTELSDDEAELFAEYLQQKFEMLKKGEDGDNDAE